VDSVAFRSSSPIARSAKRGKMKSSDTTDMVDQLTDSFVATVLTKMKEAKSSDADLLVVLQALCVALTVASGFVQALARLAGVSKEDVAQVVDGGLVLGKGLGLKYHTESGCSGCALQEELEQEVDEDSTTYLETVMSKASASDHWAGRWN